MTTIRRSIYKYPFFYTTLSLGVLGLVFRLIDKFGISDLLFIISALMAIVIGFNRMLYILRHGFFGIPALPLIGILTSLLLKETEAVAILAILLSTEQAAFSWVQARSSKKTSLLQMKHVQLVRFLDTASLPYVVLVVLIGGAVWTISGDAVRFLEVIAAASSAALILVPPLGILRGISKLKFQGISLPNAMVFEKLADVKTIVLRKSVALTYQDVEVVAVQPFGRHTKSEVIKIAAALSSQSEHHISKAIIAHTGTTQKVDRAKHSTEINGQGIMGRMKGSELIIGRASFLIKHDIDVGSTTTKNDGPEVFVGQDGELLGVIAFKETARSDAKGIEKSLRKTGVRKILLVSGSRNKAVAAIAKLAGIKDYHGDVVPNDIIQLIEDAESKPVAFVGDTVREEAVSTAADVSISVNKTSQSSSISITDYSPTKLITTFGVAKKTVRSIQKEVLIMLFVSLLLVLGAATGKASPLQAAGLHLIFLVFYIVIETVRNSKVKHLPQ